MPYIRSGNPAEVKNWNHERIRVYTTNSCSFICQFAGAKIWSDCRFCAGKRSDCTARWPNLNKRIVYIHSLEFCTDGDIRYLRRTAT